MTDVYTHEDLKILNNSCKNCFNCSKLIYHDLSGTSWNCRAPGNLLSTRNPITGQQLEKWTIIQIRQHYSPNGICNWHRPERIYYADGSSRHINQIMKEEAIVKNSKWLGRLTADDL